MVERGGQDVRVLDHPKSLSALSALPSLILSLFSLLSLVSLRALLSLLYFFSLLRRLSSLGLFSWLSPIFSFPFSPSFLPCSGQPFLLFFETHCFCLGASGRLSGLLDLNSDCFTA